MDNATVASMQGTVGRTDAGSAPGIACQQMPLSFLKGGETGTIAKVRGRGDLHHHLENLGFVEGAQVTVVSEAAGDLIVEVKGIQVALNRHRTLRDVAIGDTATVRRLTGEGALKRHIMDMGITKGTSVFVRKVAPLGDPIEVTVRGYELSLRKSEAESILIG